MHCPSCGKEIPDAAPYCAFCGMRMAAPMGYEPGEGRAATSGLAIASLILGILGLCCGITALVGLVLGIAALSQIDSSKGRLEGRGLAIAGICISAFILLLTVLYAAVALPMFTRAMHNAEFRSQQASQEAFLKELNNGMILYRNDVGYYPPSLSDLTLHQGAGPSGYQGPYITPHTVGDCVPLPCDPVTGKPFDYDRSTGIVSAPAGPRQPPPSPLWPWEEQPKQRTQEALLKELNNAVVLYRNDVGSYPAQLPDLLLPEGAGPKSYQGPYMTPHTSGNCAPLPCDPVSGKPFVYDPQTGTVTAPQ